MPNIYTSQFVGAKWAMEPRAIESFLGQLEALHESDIIMQMAVQRQTSLQVVGETAIIPISGVLLKTVPGWLRYFGIDATGYDEIQQQIEQAVAKRDVKRIHLRIASPGGVISGVDETGDMIRQARESKAVTATIEDLGASAAYWLASQAGTIDANRTAEVGSIGVYTAYVDMSGYAEGLGFKVVVIKSGKHKGIGVPGAPITDEQIEAVQEVVDSLADQFIETVALGRNMDKADVRKLATGRLWLAAAAREIGLIDAVTNSSSNQETTSEAESNTSAQGDTTMPNEQTTVPTPVADHADQTHIDQAAVSAQAQQAERQRMQDLKNEFLDDPAFAMEQFSAGADVTTAKAAYCDVLRQRHQVSTVKSDQGSTGSEPLAHNESGGNTASGDFMAEARQLARDQKIRLTDAMRQLTIEKPELYRAFLIHQDNKSPTIRGSGKGRRV